MSLIKNPKKVTGLTTKAGWRYRVVKGSLQTEYVPEGPDGEDGAFWLIFEAYHPRSFNESERVAILRSEVAQIVEASA